MVNIIKQGGDWDAPVPVAPDLLVVRRSNYINVAENENLGSLGLVCGLV